MGKRRVGGNSRVLRKKKVRGAKKGSCLDSVAAVIAAARGVKTVPLRIKKMTGHKRSGKRDQDVFAALRTERSKLLKRQAAERMVLKEHTRELEARRQRIRKGEDAKMERRELGKYIRQLQKEQEEKHRKELGAIEEAILLRTGKKAINKICQHEEWEDIDDDDEEGVGEHELHEMFAHLTT
ncbi:uncharacterized protein TEOVI_000424700 [Trypanosoma equiperdum]|uniref:Uncharacterized protein n=2 Tax=Trypanozoon TaxID=39700 RepID=Q388T3_TRYB2|nr:hypothetical protein, conserved [Trypanosoma brucei brucei TREU927]EAN78687.1 hypothetical protein, conserved [Trypanosoma brucei brucei TREU927]SCU72669.1 hypothetical protein, conserved [Trypanosoma equiperdum]